MSKAIVKADPTVEEETKQLAAGNAEILQVVRSLTIEDEDGHLHAAEVLQAVKLRAKQLDEKRKGATSQLQNVIRTINAWFAPALSPLDEAEADLKKKIAAWHVLQQQQRVAAMQQLAAAGVAGQDAQATILVPAAPEAKGISVRTVRKWRVVDADLVGRQFCSPDPKKINDYLANGGLEAIRGIEFYDEQIVSARQVK